MTVTATISNFKQRFLWKGDTAAVIGISFFTSIFLILFGQKLTSSWSQFLAVTVMVCAIALTAIRSRYALLLFIVFLFAYEEFDLSSKEAFAANVGNNSVLMVRFFGLSLMDFAAVVFLLPVLVREWKNAVDTGRWRWLKTDMLFLPILAIWLYGIVNGLFHTLTTSTFT